MYVHWQVQIGFLKPYISQSFTTGTNRILKAIYLCTFRYRSVSAFERCVCLSGYPNPLEVCYRSESDFESRVYLLGAPNGILKAIHLLVVTNWFLKVILNTVYR